MLNATDNLATHRSAASKWSFPGRLLAALVVGAWTVALSGCVLGSETADDDEDADTTEEALKKPSAHKKAQLACEAADQVAHIGVKLQNTKNYWVCQIRGTSGAGLSLKDEMKKVHSSIAGLKPYKEHQGDACGWGDYCLSWHK